MHKIDRKKEKNTKLTKNNQIRKVSTNEEKPLENQSLAETSI